MPLRRVTFSADGEFINIRLPSIFCLLPFQTGAADQYYQPEIVVLDMLVIDVLWLMTIQKLFVPLENRTYIAGVYCNGDHAEHFVAPVA